MNRTAIDRTNHQLSQPSQRHRPGRTRHLPGWGSLSGLSRRLALAAAVAAAACSGGAAWAQTPAQSAGAVAADPAQSRYLDSLREQLRRSARYPTGREASHLRAQGDVTVRFALARDGAVRDVRVVHSSDSMLLDGAALSAVRRAAYPAFARDLYPSQAGQDFQVTLSYAPAGSAHEGAMPHYAEASVKALEVAVRP